MIDKGVGDFRFYSHNKTDIITVIDYNDLNGLNKSYKYNHITIVKLYQISFSKSDIILPFKILVDEDVIKCFWTN